MQQQNTKEIILLRDKALNFVKSNGPVLPIQLSKHIGSDLILAGALLAELSSTKSISITHANIGGSPLYYVKGQEAKLPQLLYNHLKSKEKEIYDLLNKNKVLKDINLEPAYRIAIRNLKDFATPLNVTQDNKTELFWKYFLINDEESKTIIENILQKEIPTKEIPQKEEIKQIIQEKQIQEEKLQEILKKFPEPQLKKEIKEKPKQKDNFYETIKDFIAKNKIQILEEIIIRKQKEYDFIIKLPSPLGHLKYYLKAKNKITINDSDISLAYSESQQKKLPCIFIAKGKLTKKALDLEKKLSGQLTLKQI